MSWYLVQAISPAFGWSKTGGWQMGHGLDPVDQELRMAFTFFKGLKKKSDRLCDHKGYNVSCHVLQFA